MKLINTPRSIDISITHHCNLRCKYCSHFSSEGDVEDLPLSEWLRFFEELNRYNILNVTLLGGEPFFRKDLKEIIEGIKKNRMRFSILSNGTLIDDDISTFISSTKRCEGVQVSIDGSHSETHDSFRGKGNFEKALSGIESLRKHNISVPVRVTIHKKNVSDLENIAKLLLDDLKLPSFSTNSASYMGLCRKNTEQVQLTPDDRALAIETLKKLLKKYNNRITGDAGPLAELRDWTTMEKARINNAPPFPMCGFLTGCNGARQKLGVRADGIIVPCIQISSVELGKINQNDLKTIWHTHPELQKLRTRSKIPLSDFEFCKGCKYIPYCTGNCPALAYTLTDQVNHPSPDSCLRDYLKQGGTLPKVE